MKIQKIHEDDNYLFINKPAGLVVHSDGKTDEPTLAEWLLENYPDIKDVGETWTTDDGQTIERPGIVHRLDRETSGVLVISKNEEAFESAKEMFKQHKVYKTYIAVVWGHIKNDEGTVDAAIGRSPKDFRRWSAQRGARGNMREAVTHYKVLSRFESEGEKFSIIEFKPETGRTHQIRVHAKYMNHPIVSDSLYAGKREKALGFDRHALHAYSLEIPGISAQIAEFPSDFMDVFRVAGFDPASLA